MSTATDERAGLPSASDNAFWNCPGKQQLWEELGKPEGEKTAEAEDGTLIHSTFQTGNTLMLDAEQYETYSKGLEFLNGLLADWCAEAVEGPREERFWLHDAESFEPITSGKLDRHYFKPDKKAALIVDLKSGFAKGLPPSSKSTQLRVQAVCLKAERPELETIRVAYCIPKSKFGNRDFCDYTLQDLTYAENWVRQHIWLTQQDNAVRSPGPHCTFCPCKQFCKEAAAYSLLPSVIAERVVTSTKAVPEAVAQMNPVDLVKVWKASSVVRKILDAVSARLKAMSDEQLAEIGMTHAPGRKLPEVTKVSEAVKILIDSGWTMEQVYSCMKFSITDLAEVARFEKGFTNDPDSVAWVKDKLADTITENVSEQLLKELK